MGNLFDGCGSTGQVTCPGQGSGFRMQGAGRRVEGAGFKGQGSGCRVQGSWCRVWRYRSYGRGGSSDHPPVRMSKLSTFFKKPRTVTRGHSAEVNYRIFFRILVYLVTYESRQVSLEHHLVSRHPCQGGPASLWSLTANTPQASNRWTAWRFSPAKAAPLHQNGNSPLLRGLFPSTHVSGRHLGRP